MNSNRRVSDCLCKWEKAAPGLPPVLLMRDIHPDCPQHGAVLEVDRHLSENPRPGWEDGY